MSLVKSIVKSIFSNQVKYYWYKILLTKNKKPVKDKNEKYYMVKNK